MVSYRNVFLFCTQPYPPYSCAKKSTKNLHSGVPWRSWCCSQRSRIRLPKGKEWWAIEICFFFVHSHTPHLFQTNSTKNLLIAILCKDRWCSGGKIMLPEGEEKKGRSKVFLWIWGIQNQWHWKTWAKYDPRVSVWAAGAKGVGEDADDDLKTWNCWEMSCVIFQYWLGALKMLSTCPQNPFKMLSKCSQTASRNILNLMPAYKAHFFEKANPLFYYECPSSIAPWAPLPNCQVSSSSKEADLGVQVVASHLKNVCVMSAPTCIFKAMQHSIICTLNFGCSMSKT